MVYAAAALAVAALLIVLFVLRPLFWSEEEVESFDRPRPGTRNLSGPAGAELPDESQPSAPGDAVRCPECGAVSDSSYAFCGDCAARLE
ncbi:MAG: hypothetical protein V5A55_08435 [Halovenus sp.]